MSLTFSFGKEKQRPKLHASSGCMIENKARYVQLINYLY